MQQGSTQSQSNLYFTACLQQEKILSKPFIISQRGRWTSCKVTSSSSHFLGDGPFNPTPITSSSTYSLTSCNIVMSSLHRQAQSPNPWIATWPGTCYTHGPFLRRQKSGTIPRLGSESDRSDVTLGSKPGSLFLPPPTENIPSTIFHNRQKTTHVFSPLLPLLLAAKNQPCPHQ